MTVASSFPLLRTKLNRPAAAGAVIARPRLLQKLAPALERRLTLVSAAAGFGKTTLLVQWLATQPLPSAWLSLDEYDSALEVFLTYVVEAIRTCYPGACPDTLALLRAPREIPLIHIAYALTNEIAALPGGLILVLDDYHLVQAEAIHALLTTLINHAPANFHLVIATRADPPLPLARWRARQELTEVRVADLRLLAAEVATFLTGTLAIDLDIQAVGLLERAIEGWAAGLQLVAMSLREHEDTQRLLDELERGEHGHIMDFLVNEVVAASPPAVQTFLHWSALFDRFCPALCDALELVAPPYLGANDLLAEIARANLFLVRLDDTGKWFRYHHLFGATLRLRLRAQTSRAAIAAMQRRAAEWFVANDLVEEGLEHALAAEDFDMAAAIVADGAAARLNAEDWRGAERLLGRLPEELVRQRPALLLARGCTLVIRMQPERLPPLVAAIDAQLAAPHLTDRAALDAQLCVLHAVVLQDDQATDIAGSYAYAVRALKELPRDALLPRRLALICYVMVSQRLGREEEAQVLLTQFLAHEGAAVNTFTEGVAIMLGQLYADKGDLDGMERIVRRTLDQRRRSTLLLSTLGAALVRAGFFYFRYRLPEAQQELEPVLRTPYGGRPGIVLQSAMLLALLHELQGEQVQSDEVMAMLGAYLAQDGNAAMQAIYAAFQARLSLMRGEIDAALRWAAQNRPAWQRTNNDEIDTPILVYVAVRIAQATPASLAEADDLLLLLEEEMVRTHFVRRRVQVVLLRCAAALARGDDAAGLAALRQAVELARPGRILVHFAEQGAPVCRLLRRLAEQVPGDSFVAELLAILPAAAAGNGAQRPPARLDRRDVEDLTTREAEILRLLEQGWSNAEIAGALVLSLLTVKRHIANLYQKLGVNSRTRAVRRGRELGLLPPA